MRLKPSSALSGFTLVEIVIGIVVLAIALLVITSALGPLYQRSADPWHQVRAAELGQSFLNEIMARSFDENSDRAGGQYRCDADAGIEPGAQDCTSPVSSGSGDVFPQDPAGCESSGSCESREGFDDVDDFDGFSSDGGLKNIRSDELLNSYRNYQVRVKVIYDGNYNGKQDEIQAKTPGSEERQAKLVTVTVTTPAGEDIRFSAYKANW